MNAKFEEIEGVKKAYFQPGRSTKLVYPCIIYNISDIDVDRADDRAYQQRTRYSVEVIDPDPDSDIPHRLVQAFRMCSYDRFYTADNLNHHVYTIYF